MAGVNHEKYFKLAAEVAKGATCERARCGSVIADKTGVVIGKGYNAPPLDDEAQRTCNTRLDLSLKPKYDKTCCVHAEWNAIIDACKTNGDKLSGATLYFMRIDEAGNFTEAGEPYCTVCSRLAMQSGVSVFGLWNDGPDMIDTSEYNRRSYEYYKKPYFTQKTLAFLLKNVYIGYLVSECSI